MTAGQLLFKRAGGILKDQPLALESFIKFDFAFTLGSALLLYFLATCLWVLVLRDLALSKAYPMMATSFLLVPALAYFQLGESLGAKQLVGLLMIVGGIVLSSF
ncbi:EamA family transporter [Aestuariivirga litoralis]|uniref:EamA family transporter n=1 Tax=Aestuariivirga litoralis TaxID=2650924 RepID=UPI0018C5EAED|nr:EamA family transporter [Aestuariivirga litoralis]